MRWVRGFRRSERSEELPTSAVTIEVDASYASISTPPGGSVPSGEVAVKNLTDQIPVEFMRPERKVEVSAWIKASRLPYRFRRGLLQAWAEAVSVTLVAEDYMAVTDWKPGGSSLAGQRT